MDVTKEILVAAKDISFLTNYEARILLQLTTSADENLDDMIEILIKWCSDEIATECGRAFAKETLIETFREVNNDTRRLWLTHYPIQEIESVVANGVTLVEGTDYSVDWDDGKLYRVGGIWADPTVVTYTGGYDLPFECPPALQKACVLVAREAYFAATRGDASIRMVAHKGARVMYFDPNAKSAASSSSGSAASRAIKSLLEAYMRYEV